MIFANEKIRAQVTADDFTGIQYLYTNAGGTTWTNQNGWNTLGNPFTFNTSVNNNWVGLTVISPSLTRINLANNNLTGTIPAEISYFGELTALYLQNNELTKLLNFLIPTLDTLNVSNNRLTFDDLLQYIPLFHNNPSFYSPQKDFFLTASPIMLNTGTSLHLQTNFNATGNVYQWYKNGVAIAGATGTSFNITSVNKYNAGFYVVQITNPGVPHLTIQCQPVQVEINFASHITASTNITCFNANNGTATIASAGGVLPLKYKWTTKSGTVVDSFANTTGLAAGSYYGLVVDSLGSVSKDSITITQPNALTLAIDTVQNICFGDATASIKLTAGGGVTPYKYTITGIAGFALTNGTYSNLSNGNYFPAVQDANNCITKIDTVKIINKSNIKISYFSKFDIYNCFGDSSGSMQINAVGTGNPFYYRIDNKAFTKIYSFPNLKAGNHTISIRDDYLCIKDTIVAITQPTDISIDSSHYSKTLRCFYTTDGYVKVYAHGGSGKLTYFLNGATASDSGIYQSLSYGSFDVKIVDAHNCSKTNTFTIKIPDTLKITNIQKNAINCFGDSSGTVNVTAIGGTGKLKYSINGFTYQTNNIFAKVPAATYSVSVVDSNLCLTSQTINLTQPPAIVNSVLYPAVLNCYGDSTGYIHIIASGGTGTLMYQLNNGAFQNTYLFDNLKAGIYNTTIRDGSNCMVKGSYQIKNPPKITFSSIDTSSVHCFGASTGVIKINAVGGTGGFRYKAIDNNFYSNNSFSGLPAGLYNVSVKDLNNCHKDTFAIIAQPAVLKINNFVITSPKCFNDSNGIMTVNATGGTGSYIYAFDGKAYQTSNILTFVKGGQQTIHVRDFYNCPLDSTINVPQPAALTIANANVINVLCAGTSTGSINLNITGGTGIKSFSINNAAPQLSNVFTNLAFGKYMIVVKDQNNCTTTSTYSVIQPYPLKIGSIYSQNVHCNGDSSGVIAEIAVGGTGNYFYKLIIGADTLTQKYGNFTHLGPGKYTALLTDDNKCVTLQPNIILTQPPPFKVTKFIYKPITCNNYNNASFQVQGIGGTKPLNYFITRNNAVTYTSTTGTFTGLPPASYVVGIRDSNNCNYYVDTTNIVNPPVLLLDSVRSNNISCHNLVDGNINIYVHGGVAPINYYLYRTKDTIVQQQNTFAKLTAGTYKMAFKDANTCMITTNQVTIINPPQLLIDSVRYKNITCNNLTDGFIKVYAHGGTPKIYYSQDNGLNYLTNNGIFANAGVGSYHVKVMDNNKCKATNIDTTFTIVNPAPMSATFAPDTTSGCNPLTVIFTNHSNNAITYQWNFGDGNIVTDTKPLNKTHVYTNTSAGYESFKAKLVCKNAYGCADSNYYNITVFNNFHVTYDLTPLTQIFPEQHTIYFTPTGNVAQQSYVWVISSGDTLKGMVDYFDKFKTAGVYTIKAWMNNVECSDTATKSFELIPHPVSGFQFTSSKDGCSPVFVSLKNTSQYATKYFWDFGDSTQSIMLNPQHTYTKPGQYVIQLYVQGRGGISPVYADTVNVWGQPSKVDILIKPDSVLTMDQPIHCHLLTDGWTYYTWYFGDGDTSHLWSPIHFYKTPGEYKITLDVWTDHLCSDANMIGDSIKVLPNGWIYFPNAFTPNTKYKPGNIVDYKDRSNNVFYPHTYLVDQYDLKIYTRWGIEVYHSTKLNIGWDGYYNGKLLPSDMYVYKAMGYYTSGMPFSVIGSFLLLK